MLKLKRASKLARYCLTGIVVLSMSALALPPVINIYTLEDLKKIGTDPDYPLNQHYALRADIDIPASQFWTPIGKSIVEHGDDRLVCPPIGSCPPFANRAQNALYDGAFKGSFYGNGHTIRGLRMQYEHTLPPPGIPETLPPALVSAGLFGALDGAVITDLNIEAEMITVGGYFAAGGALAGFVRGGAIRNVNVKGTLHGITRAEEGSDLSVGGLVGSAENSAITRCSSVVTVRAMLHSTNELLVGIDGSVGGLVGTNINTPVTECHAITAIGGKGGRSIGGLVGENIGGVITKSSAETKIAPTYTGVLPIALPPEAVFVNIGGLVGLNTAQHLYCPPEHECPALAPIAGMIKQSYAEVDMEGVIGIGETVMAIEGGLSRVGGLVGTNHTNATIDDCYAVGTIKSSNIRNTFGGLVGIAEDPSPFTIERSYAAVAINVEISPSIERGDTRGGLVGAINSMLSVQHFTTSYFDTEISVIGGEHGKTTAEMRMQSTFAGWNFEDIWRIDEGESYPYLAWQQGTNTSISNRQITRGANRNSLAPAVTVRGKTLNVKTLSSTQNLQVRLIDMRGRTMARFDMTGGGNMSLNKISAGRYIVDMRDMGTGMRFTSPIVVR